MARGLKVFKRIGIIARVLISRPVHMISRCVLVMVMIGPRKIVIKMIV